MKPMIVLLVLILSPVTVGAQDLGGNYNQALRNIYNALIVKSGVSWVRAFVNIPRNYLTFDADRAITGVLDSNLAEVADAVSTDSEVLATAAVGKLVETTSVRVNGQPVKVILSLKVDFKYPKGGVPEVGTPAMNYLMTAIEKFLTTHNRGAYVDILVVGNEPMFEVPESDADKYEAYLGLLIDKVDALRTANAGWKFEIFTGALNRASELGTKMPPNPILEKILKITKENAKVSGIDLHLHVADPDVAEADINFVRNTQGIGKKIISTEFSLVGLWDAHKNDTLGTWGEQNGYSGDMRFYEWINALSMKAAAGNPVSGDHFKSYFDAQPWYPGNWFTTMFNTFQKYNLYAVTYGLESPPRIPASLDLLNENSTLWVLNFIYNGTILGTSADGYYNTNPLVFPDFADAITGMRTSHVRNDRHSIED